MTVKETKKGKTSKAESSSDDDVTLSRKTKKETKKPAPKKEDAKVKKEKEPEEDTMIKWWEEGTQHPGGQHWLTLEHNGVLFPPEYVPHGLPCHYKMEDGKLKEIKMEPDEEEVCTMFAVMREQTRPPSDYYINPIFRKNFFMDWLQILNSNPERNMKRFGSKQHPIRSLEKVNFDRIWEWHLEQKEIKKALTKEQKLQIKKEKDEAEQLYKYCIWDGKKQPVGNFRIEPPGLFRGRGKHPLMGKLKRRVKPEDITINIGPGAKVPEAPAGHKWKEVRTDNMVTWLANWTENVNGQGKYVMLAASSMVKGKSDHKKFENARKLGQMIDSIREKYREGWKSPDVGIQQRSVAMYFIDFLALRCGHEKGEDEAETFGACSLKCEHINLEEERDHVVFDFLGKDSIRYYNKVKVESKVWELLRKFVKGKTPNSDLFDRLIPTHLNSYLKELMPGLSAKVFRTYNASWTLDKEFFDDPVSDSISLPEKLVYFNAANTKVAILCNHQKSVGKGFQKAMTVLEDRLKMLKNLYSRLEDVKELSKKHKNNWQAKVDEQWEKDEHEQQQAWLEQYGTEEEKTAYKEKRAGKKPSKPKTTTATTTTKSSSSKPKEPEKKKSDPKPKTKREKKQMESDSDSDIPLAKKKKASKSAKGDDSGSDVPKKKSKKTKLEKRKAFESSEEDEPMKKKSKK
uniref:DNA topoisomerase I n=1 Tax=Eutreptiella gymnastica TaxID=73025 RepID=A0A7S1JE07_9EUGL|mmetsp:Transcript_89451/g.154951  ORF Transcript_89451/g.154951 Transcript_89451/m.154951 type:complete len:685 (+) Transcript_89451:65-2119(+)